jgi:hypothetical protein
VSTWNKVGNIKGPPGPAGPPGTGGGSGSATYRHVQNTASSTWTVNHNLGYFPAVSVVDSAKRVVHGDIAYSADGQTVTLSFTAAFSGEAYFS